MDRNLPFNQLRDHERAQARRDLRRDFAGVLVGLEEGPEATVYSLQMEVVESRAHRLLGHRILAACYSPEPLIAGKRLFLHRLEFMAEGQPMPGAGALEVLFLPDAELWDVLRILRRAERSDCQAVVATEAVLLALRLPQLEPLLSSRLKGLDLEAITLRAARPDRPRGPGGRQVDAEA